MHNMNQIKENFTALWENQYQGRPLIHLKAIKDGRPLIHRGDMFPYGLKDINLKDFYTNPDTLVKRHRYYLEGTEHFGVAFPRAVLQMGPGILAAYHGANINYGPDTIWFDELVNNWEEDFVEFSEDNPEWLLTKKLLTAMIDDANGDYYVGLPDLNSVSNALSLIRGSGELSMDLLLDPDSVKKYTAKIMDTWKYTLTELYKIVKDKQDGYTDWMGLWAPDLGFAVQSDFSTLISSDMFDEFFMPEIREQSKMLDYTCYHLDGPQCIRHLDLLLNVDNLRGIQWQPGAGAPPASDPKWYPMLHQIQDSGRFVYAYASMDQVIPLVKELDNNKLFIYVTEYAKNPKQAKELMDEINRISKNK